MESEVFALPVLDLESFLDEGQERLAQREAVAKDICKLLKEVGFLYVKVPDASRQYDSFINQKEVETLFELAKQYFSLPKEKKEKNQWTDSSSNSGYVAVEREHLDKERNRRGDLKEAFNVGRPEQMVRFWKTIISVAEGEERKEREHFRDLVTKFFMRCAKTAEVIHQAIALGLGLEQTFFQDKLSERCHTLRLLHYPLLDKQQVEKAKEVCQTRAGIHTDYGAITLLFQDDVGGLEVEAPDGRWKSIPYLPGTMVVNTGDLMQRWTNDTVKSTKHRVVVSEQQKIYGRDRYSIAFFVHPNDSTDISPLEVCVTPERPSKYPIPVCAGDYLLAKLNATYHKV